MRINKTLKILCIHKNKMYKIVNQKETITREIKIMSNQLTIDVTTSLRILRGIIPGEQSNKELLLRDGRDKINSLQKSLYMPNLNKRMNNSKILSQKYKLVYKTLLINKMILLANQLFPVLIWTMFKTIILFKQKFWAFWNSWIIALKFSKK